MTLGHFICTVDITIYNKKVASEMAPLFFVDTDFYYLGSAEKKSKISIIAVKAKK